MNIIMAILVKDPSKKVLWTNTMNDGVDQAAERLEVCAKSLEVKNLLIIRLRTLKTEQNKFKSQRIEVDFISDVEDGALNPKGDLDGK